MNALGGPGVACSAIRVRRFAAGELAGDERARTQDHLAACARCQETVREIGDERLRVAAELPFEALAAGVAERLASPAGGRAGRAGRLGRAVSRWAPAVALAAGVLLAVTYPTLLRLGGEGASVRTKGAAEVTLWVREGAEARALAPDEPVPVRAALRVGLSPAGRRFAAVALVDADGPVILHAGAAQAGVLPGAFEWTGAGTGTLVVVLDDVPIDPAALAERLAHGGPAAARPRSGAEVIVRPLRRGDGR
jgi:hypothetical protein